MAAAHVAREVAGISCIEDSPTNPVADATELSSFAARLSLIADTYAERVDRLPIRA